jgi:hypothetical protein
MVAGLAVAAACGRQNFDPAHNIVFVTSTAHVPAEFGADLAGADAICAARAAEAGLPGPYRAYLATSRVRAPDRLENARGWVRVDGRPVVDRISDLTSGQFLYPPRLDEHGDDFGDSDEPVATGAAADGSLDQSGNCTDYTDSAGGVAAGFVGRTMEQWRGRGSSLPCSSAVRLYCFGIAYDTPLQFTPAIGRRAFVTAQAFMPGGGLAAADALCASEASLAGLGGAYRAWLATDLASGASRFDLSRPTWVRVDGVELAESRLAFVSGLLLAAPNLTSLGAHTSGVVITGGAAGQRSDRTCGDWTDPASGTGYGLMHATSMTAFARGVDFAACSGRPIYCFEE